MRPGGVTAGGTGTCGASPRFAHFASSGARRVPDGPGDLPAAGRILLHQVDELPVVPRGVIAVDGIQGHPVRAANEPPLAGRLDGFQLVERPRSLHLTAINGYEFPKARPFAALDHPRPLGVDPIRWILDNTTEEDLRLIRR